MKTQRKYTMSAMGLVTNDCSILATFHGDKLYDGPLSGLAIWAKDNNVGVLQRCTSEGARHGLFPCLLATNERVASALSVYSGYEVAVGDGRSFFTREDARKCFTILRRAGVPVSLDDLAWAITDVAYPEPESKPPSRITQPSSAQQHQDCFL